ncbi:MAG: hypothetical protein ABMA64_03370 [Myxococcota bacterium]
MRPYVVAFLAGLTSLALELLLVRMLAFFLTSSADFLAIPLALFGLALGSMGAHFVYRGSPDRLVAGASAAVLPVTLGSLLTLFWTFDTYFHRVQVFVATPGEDAVRLVVYTAILLPPFVVFGALFAGLFSANADRLGRLYAADLAGAAAGCVLAPALLTVSGLPAALAGVLACALLLFVAVERPLWSVGAAAAAWLAVAGGVASGHLFREHPDTAVLANSTIPGDKKGTPVTPLAVRWNEIARTALVRVDYPDTPNYYVVQDNGLSNVGVFSPERSRRGASVIHGLAWDLGRDPARILVMFAGAGRDLMWFDAESGGKANLTGVEINPAVVDLASKGPVRRLGIAEFLARPNVSLVVQEGRDFLNHDRGRYELIHVANNGAVFASRTGHTRKFLDTKEAMAAYLDHLTPDGLLVFARQPIAEKLSSFEELFAERELGSFADASWVMGQQKIPELHTLVVAPGGLTRGEVAALAAVASDDHQWVLHAPGDDALPGLTNGRRVVDDRPFPRSLQLERLRPFPRASDLDDLAYVASWVKVFTVLLFGALSAVAGAAVLAVGRGEGRVPAAWIAYLLWTGVGYMCVEIGLIARTELFVGNPLYAVAVNLAVFLVASAAGSAASERWRWPPLTLAAATVAAVAWGLATTAAVTRFGLSAPLVVKVLGVAIAVGPAGAALGTFYPHAVHRLVGEGRTLAVPATYALTTLSSVLGSAFAMTAIVELGFVRVIGLGVVCYLIAGGLAHNRPAVVLSVR